MIQKFFNVFFKSTQNFASNGEQFEGFWSETLKAKASMKFQGIDFSISENSSAANVLTWTQVYLTAKSPLFSILIILRHCVIAQSQIQILFSLWILMIVCSWWLIQSLQVIFHYSYVITCSRSSNCNKVNSYQLYVVLRESCSWFRGFIWCLHEMCAVDLAFYK